VHSASYIVVLLARGFSHMKMQVLFVPGQTPATLEATRTLQTLLRVLMRAAASRQAVVSVATGRI
jgi:hypothetical protein